MIGVSYSPFCKYCMGVNAKPGESKVYCGLDDSWHTVTAGNCFGHCDKQEVIDGTEPAKWIEPTEDAESECCANCRRAYRLEKLDYSKGGCEHTDMEGYICMAFADEGLASWMVGNNPDTGMCECYAPKKDTGERNALH